MSIGEGTCTPSTLPKWLVVMLFSIRGNAMFRAASTMPSECIHGHHAPAPNEASTEALAQAQTHRSALRPGIATQGAGVLVPSLSASASVSVSNSVSNSAPPDAEDVLRLIYANASRPALYKDLWGEVAKFSVRNDALSLRSVSTDMSRWLDKSITSLECQATEAGETLAALHNATNLKHINTLRIRNCTDANFSAVIAALASVPDDLLATLHVSLMGQRSSWRAFGGIASEGLAMTQLRGLAPASLHFTDISSATPAVALQWASCEYPVHLRMSRMGDVLNNNALGALARIPRLATLDVTVNNVSDDNAHVLGHHSALTDLRLATPWAIDISNDALTAIASSTTLRALYLEGTKQVFGEEVVAAFAQNRTLERLDLKGISRFFDESFAMTLSGNTTLKTLQIPVISGAGHFASMQSLEHLTLGGHITLEDARQFAQHASLKTLHCGHVLFEPGALAELAKTAMQKFMLTVDLALDEAVLTDDAIDAFLSNSTLRSLSLHLPAEEDGEITHAIRLAGHPTLTSLSICYSKPPGEDVHLVPEPTALQSAELLAAWGTHRPADALVVRV